MLTERDECSYELMKQFDSLPYKHKAILSHLPYPEIICAHYIKGFEKEKECGLLSDFIPNQFMGKRYYDQFDYVKWFNK